MMKHVQLAIIGGGPAGLAAAAAARKAGVEDLLIIERDRELGGILNQCIHAGFGLHTFSRELTGPEYARRFAGQVRELNIPYLLNTMVLDLSPDRVLTLTGRETGLVQLSADAVILAMGCRERLEGVTLAQVDGNRRPIPGTERDIPCDTLLLSVGLLPENELSQQAGVRLDAVTGGPEVGDDLSTSVPGVFACGNVLHVHDLVDFVSQEAARAGENAARYLLERRREDKTIRLTGQNGVRYTVPQYLDPEAMEETVTVRFRVGQPYRDADLAVYLDGRLLRRVHKRILSPGEMEQLTLRRADLPRGLKQITIQVEEGAQ